MIRFFNRGKGIRVISFLFYTESVDRSIQDNFFRIAEHIIRRGDNHLAGMQTGCNFIILRILTGDRDVPANGSLAIGCNDEYPSATGILIEGSTWDHDGFGRLSETQIDVVGLACADIVGSLSVEYEVGTELLVPNLGVHLPDTKGEVYPAVRTKRPDRL